MEKNNSNWRQSVSIKFPTMLLLGVLLVMSSFSFAQSNANTNVPIARMTLDNSVTIRTGLNASYKISIAHFGFASSQEAVAYFQERDVNHVDFVVLDTATVLMNFDLNDPTVSGWALSEWEQVLATRASNSAPRILPSN